MKVCEQTVKPTARPLSERWREAFCLPAHCQWHVIGGRCIAFGQTLDEALANWREVRLQEQIQEQWKCD